MPRASLLILLIVLLSDIGNLRAATLPYAESFSGANGDPWPAPWFPGAASVTVSDIQGGRGRLNGWDTFVSRMILPGYADVNVEALLTVEFANVGGQGIGFYVRQNGGTLREYQPHGQGYAMFLKGSWAWPEDLGIWREIDGIETQFQTGYNPLVGGLLNGVPYRLRFRVFQSSPDTTRLLARVWRENELEPVAWTVEASDTRAELQGTAGSYAIDLYNHFGGAPIFIDDIVITIWTSSTGVPDVGAPEGGARITLAAPRPNPVTAGGGVRVEATLVAPGMARLDAYDTQGRRVAFVFEGPLDSGTVVFHWQPRDATGTRLPAGVYFLTLTAAGTTTSRRVVVTD
ncbi:MAG: hypothetical protein FD129_374 [bacterium]|nr:MAG: hypothetical protein FD129_374 [bacterium]